MTIQFNNRSGGKIPNDQIYIAIIGRNGTGAYDPFCYLKPDGTVVPVSVGDTSENWFFRLSDINGFQVPKTFTSVRLYISISNKVIMRGVASDIGVGIVQPDMNNPSDPNQTIIFDWVEFTIIDGHFWGNTTQVDQFGFPFTLSLYQTGDSFVRKVGITNTRDQVFTMYQNSVPTEFKTLVKAPYRIIAPAKGDFRDGRTYGTYFDSYVNQIWDQYRTQTLYISHPWFGSFTGRVEGDAFVFTRTSDGLRAIINRKPNTTEVLEGSGVLASGSDIEKALQAKVCAALNRHVMQLTNANDWDNPLNYYKAEPMNYYSKFFHNISIDGYAYGFCYDDVSEQSTLIEVPSTRGAIIDIYW